MKFLILTLLVLPSLAFAKTRRGNLTVRCENGGIYTFTPNGNGKVDKQGNWLWLDLDYERSGYTLSINSLQNKVHCEQIAPAYKVYLPTRPLPNVPCRNVYVPAQVYVSLGVPIAVTGHYECL